MPPLKKKHVEQHTTSFSGYPGKKLMPVPFEREPKETSCTGLKNNNIHASWGSSRAAASWGHVSKSITFG
jgi:hypothetical protein